MAKRVYEVEIAEAEGDRVMGTIAIKTMTVRAESHKDAVRTVTGLPMENIVAIATGSRGYDHPRYVTVGETYLGTTPLIVDVKLVAELPETVGFDEIEEGEIFNIKDPSDMREEPFVAKCYVRVRPFKWDDVMANALRFSHYDGMMAPTAISDRTRVIRGTYTDKDGFMPEEVA